MAALKVRAALPGDADAILELHERHGKQFYVPDPASPENLIACIVEDDTGLVVGAGLILLANLALVRFARVGTGLGSSVWPPKWMRQASSPEAMVADRETSVPSSRAKTLVSTSHSWGKRAATWATGQWCWQSSPSSWADAK